MWIPQLTFIFVFGGLVYLLDKACYETMTRMLDRLLPYVVRNEDRHFLRPLGFQNRRWLATLLATTYTMFALFKQIGVCLAWRPFDAWRIFTLFMVIFLVMLMMMLTNEAFCYSRLTRLQFFGIILWLLFLDLALPFHDLYCHQGRFTPLYGFY